ncbi:MAG: ferredoxin--NADP reductase [Betaproteobacteria bacterium]|nr:ferredoxin--NADP reductase [Betaproteobacteria bacterium]
MLESGVPVGLARPPQAVATRFTIESVIAVRHWTPRLVSFRTSRAPGFRFTPGHYTRVALAGADADLVWRPFSVVSATYDPHLEFVATVVPGGQFSDRLADPRGPPAGQSHGFRARRATSLAAQTAASSVLRSGDLPFRTVVASTASELTYRAEIAAIPHEDPTAIEPERLKYVPVVTRESCPGALNARIPQLIEGGQLASAAAMSLDPRRSRIMVCGNPDLGLAPRRQLTARDFHVNRRGTPGQLAFENYWQGTP